MTPNNQRVAYVNGEVVPEMEAKISIRDAGLVYGDSVFDTARTFNGQLFRLEEHVDRLFQSLRYSYIDPGMSKQEIIDITNSLVTTNNQFLRDGEDYWVTQRITTGMQKLDGEPSGQTGPSVLIDCIPLPLRARARYFRDGIEAAVAERKRIPPEALSANIKSNNYLNMMLAQREVQQQHPSAWALMCDTHGDIAEGAGCNYFMVKDENVFTPTREFVLPGISRQVVFEICQNLGIPVNEQSITVQQALDADEAFFTSTSLCICPVKSLNQNTYPGGIPGNITQQITDAFSKLVNFDFVGQYLNFLSDSDGSTGL